MPEFNLLPAVFKHTSLSFLFSNLCFANDCKALLQTSCGSWPLDYPHWDLHALVFHPPALWNVFSVFKVSHSHMETFLSLGW